MRTITKPLAARMSAGAESNPTFRGYLISLGQFAHNIETRVTARMQGHSIKKVSLFVCSDWCSSYP